MRKCPFCNKLVGNSPHIYFCKSKTSDDKNEIKFLYISHNFPLISNKDVIIENYVNKLMSLPDIKSEFGIDSKSFIFLLNYYNIESRNISTSSKLISVGKHKKTCMLKYGVDNVSKVKEIKELKKSTFLKNYGVDNIFKDESFKKWICDNNFAWNRLSNEQNIERNKKQTLSIKKYWESLTDEQKSKLFHYNGTSNLETKISEVLNYLSISYTTQFLLKGKLFDFRLSNTNILIEVNGDYWHCNPIKYKIDEVVRFPGREEKVFNIWEKDRKKKELAEKEGFNVIYIWEDEIKKSTNLYELVYNKIDYKK
jgi:G:T-mismatch repair DNA endonuclease (very short patch repair protein)